MDKRITVHLGGRREYETRPHSPGKFQQVVGTDRVHEQRLDRILPVTDRARWASEMKDGIGLDIDPLSDILLDESEERVRQKVSNVVQPSSQETVDSDDLVTVQEQRLTKMGTDKARPTRHQDAHDGLPSSTAALVTETRQI
jgi:hypothetical protein